MLQYIVHGVMQEMYTSLKGILPEHACLTYMLCIDLLYIYNDCISDNEGHPTAKFSQKC